MNSSNNSSLGSPICQCSNVAVIHGDIYIHLSYCIIVCPLFRAASDGSIEVEDQVSQEILPLGNKAKEAPSWREKLAGT